MVVYKVKGVVLASVLLTGISLGHTEVVWAHKGFFVGQWNDVALQAVRNVKPGPSIAARALAITHTCMFDAWAVYDSKAIPTQLNVSLRRPHAERIVTYKEKAMSFAANACLADLFPSQRSLFNGLMVKLGYNPNETPQNETDPSNMGKAAAAAVLKYRHNDGSNQLGDLHPGGYSDYTGYQPVNTPTKIIDPDHWQPLLVNGKVQSFLTPHWGLVKPYSLTAGNQFRSLMVVPASYKKSPRRYQEQAQQILDYSAHLTDEKKVIAEYWADGPNSELPPGHWLLFADYVAKRDHYNLDKEIKLFFSVSNALFDASIAAWDSKRFYDYVRPITAIHFLYAGKMVNSWNGPVKGEAWQPYQIASFPTPPFPEYSSGHSLYSAAAAETLRLFTRSDYFGYSATVKKGSSRVQPRTVPARDVTLYWSTFTDAADEAGLSRRYGGIHFVDGDLQSRRVGRVLARQAWNKTLSHLGLK